MNAARRKAISAIDTTTIRAMIDTLKQAIENAKEEVEAIRDEEQEYYDAMPESLQGGEKGEKASDDIDALDAFAEAMDTADMDEIASACDNLDEHGF